MRPTPETNRHVQGLCDNDNLGSHECWNITIEFARILERERDKMKAIATWFCNGQVGASSQAMAAVAVGTVRDDSHPWDPDDFNRCLLLLEAVPEIREDFPEIAKLSPEWAAFIRRWDEIEKSFVDEAGLGWSKARSAPRTYRLIDDVIKSAKGGVK